MADPRNPQVPMVPTTRPATSPIIPSGYDAIIDRSQPYWGGGYVASGDARPGALVYDPSMPEGLRSSILTRIDENKGAYFQPLGFGDAVPPHFQKMRQNYLFRKQSLSPNPFFYRRCPVCPHQAGIQRRTMERFWGSRDSPQTPLPLQMDRDRESPRFLEQTRL